VVAANFKATVNTSPLSELPAGKSGGILNMHGFDYFAGHLGEYTLPA
jgi:hypothetical protein